MPANVAETLVQEVVLYDEFAALPNLPDAPLYEGNMDERETWSTSHLMPLEMRDHLNRGDPAW